MSRTKKKKKKGKLTIVLSKKITGRLVKNGKDMKRLNDYILGFTGESLVAIPRGLQYTRVRHVVEGQTHHGR